MKTWIIQLLAGAISSLGVCAALLEPAPTDGSQNNQTSRWDTTTTITTKAQPAQARGAERRPTLTQAKEEIKAGRFVTAETLLDQVIQSFRALMKNPEATYVCFEEASELREFRRQNPTLQTVVWLDYSFAGALQTKGYLCAHRRDFKGALRWLEEAGQVAPFAANVHIERGFVLAQRDQPKLALQAYEKALGISRQTRSARQEEGAALRSVGVMLVELGDLEKAEVNLRESLKVEPGNRIALNELQYIAELRRMRSQGTPGAK